MKKNLYILFAVFLSVLSIIESKGQCFDYYEVGTSNDTCFIAGNDIQLDYTGTHWGWRIDSLSAATPIVFEFPNIGSYTWMNPPSGTYIISPLDMFAGVISGCSDTITILPGPLLLSDTTLTYCQGNTINLANLLTINNLQNGGTYPQYIFVDGLGDTVNGYGYTLNNAGITIIDVTVLAGGCIDNSQITINATPSNIPIPNYTISDNTGNQNVIQACSTSDITCVVDNPSTGFTYNWIIEGDTILDPTPPQTFVGPNYANPSIIPVILQISDGSCSIDVFDTIMCVGIGTLGTWAVQSDPIPLCIDSFSTVYVENNYLPINNIGPGDQIIWTTFCGNLLIDSVMWTYSNGISTMPASIEYLNPLSNSVVQITPYQVLLSSESCNCTYPNLPAFYAGKYRIDVEIIPACGASDGKSLPKAVNEPIQAEFDINPNPVCEGDTINFGNLSNIGCDSITLESGEDTLWYYWDFGDCSPIIDTFAVLPSDTFPDMTYAYDEPGIYSVLLSATSYCGTTEKTVDIEVLPGPGSIEPVISKTDICLGDDVSVSAIVFGIDPNPTTREDTCFDALGDIDTIITTQVPAGDTSLIYEWCFSWDLDTDSCDSGYTVPTGSISTAVWTYDDSCGIYNINVNVINGDGCMLDTVFPPVRVFSPPTADFDFNVVCVPDSTPITDLSVPGECNDSITGNGGPNIINPLEQWVWSFGDGSDNDTVSNPPNTAGFTLSHAYSPLCTTNISTIYNVFLTVTDTLGCWDTITLPVTVLCEQIAAFDTNDFCYLDANGNVNLTPYPISNNSSPLTATDDVIWTVYGDPLPNSIQTYNNSIDLPHIFSGPGLYSVVMEIDADPLDPDNCSGKDSASIEVWDNTTPTFNVVGPYCYGDPIPALPTTSINGISGTWSPALDNTTTTTYTFTPTSAAVPECAIPTTLIITINPLTTPTFNVVDDYCYGDLIPALPTTSINGISGTWSPALDNTTTTTYTFTPTSAALPECAIPTTLIITINPLTTPTFNVVDDYCYGDLIPALPTTSINGISGTWSPALDNTTTTTYTFTPTSAALPECAIPTTLIITINPLTTPTFNVVDDYCYGDPIPALPTTSINGISGTWSPALDNTTTTTYTFTPTSAAVPDCAIPTTLIISINPLTTPTFNVVDDYCYGDPIPALPTTSINGISGTWSPAIDNTTTTTYTFTPTSAAVPECAIPTTLIISINPLTTPTFNVVDDYCYGDPIPALPTTSINGISGTWSPALDNTTTTTYTFIPTSAAVPECAIPTTLIITINPLTTPTFNVVDDYCYGDPIPALPTTSINGISGTWSPAIDNTTTTTYTFTPTSAAVPECAIPTTLIITITPSTTPTFNVVDDYCYGDLIPVLPTTSINGISGTWSPAIDNTTTTTYTFTPTSAAVPECAIPTTLIITITPSTTPTFNVVDDYCYGDPIPALPTTSINGISGTWSPALDNTTTTTYTFTPTSAALPECAIPTTLIITINPLTTPTFNVVDDYCYGDPIPALPTTSINGISGTWSPAIDNTTTTTYTFTPTSAAVPECAIPTTLIITINPLTTPTFNVVDDYCYGDLIPVLPTTSINGISGTWSPAIDNTTTTTYTFTPTSAAVPECAIPTTLIITITPSTTPTFNVVDDYCYGDLIPALPTTSINGISGTWSPALDNTTTTTYTFTPTSAALPECAIPTTLIITINPLTTPTFNVVDDYCYGDPIPALPTTSINGISGTWSPALDNTTTTTYTFTPTSGALPECAIPTTLIITINPLTTPTFNVVDDYCYGDLIPALPTTSINGISGTWSPALDNTTTTTYTFTPTSAAVPECAIPTTLIITINPLTTPTFNAVGPYCYGDPIPALPTTSINGISGTWSPALDNTTTTTYTFTPISAAVPECAIPTTLIITITPSTTPTFNVVDDYCYGDPIPALPTTSINGISGTWSPAIDNTTTTTYTFTPTSAALPECAIPTTLIISINPLTTPTFNVVDDYCYGDPIPALPTTSINGISGTWSPALDNTTTTTYTFTPTSAAVPECAIPTTLIITINPLTTPTFNAVGPYCYGDPIPALPTTSINGISGTWSPALDNTTTTTYTFTPISAAVPECAIPTTLIITITPSTTPTFNVVDDYCYGDPIPALPTTSINGISGTWSPAIDNTTTTTYTFTPISAAVPECAIPTTLIITINPLTTPTFNVVDDYCYGDPIPALPTTSINGISGTWSPALDNTTTTTYTFTPTSGALPECAIPTTLIITINPLTTPTFNVVDDYCYGDLIPALPTTSINGISGTWSPALDNTTTTTYTFTPTSAAVPECAIPTTLIITINPLTTPTFNAVGPYCYGDPIPALPTTSINGISGTWSPALDNTTTTTYTFTPISAAVPECAIPTTLIISITPGPYFTTQPLDSTVCEDALLTINIDYYSNIAGAATFQWYENNIPDSTDLSSPITGIPSATTNTLDLSTFTASAGTTYYYCTVELPSGGCDIITSNCAEIIVNPDPQIDIHPLADDTICEGGTITNALTVSYLAGTGAGNETYQWYDGIYPTGNPATTGIGFTTDTYMPLTTGLTAGSYSYYAIISFDGNDCQDAVSNQANIEVLPDPIVTITQGLNQMLCEGTSIDDICVSVSGGTVLGTYQYQWFESINGGPVGPTSGVGSNTACYTPQNNIVSITEYYCVITQLDLNGNPQGCEDTSIIATVEIIPGPYFTVQPLDSTVCEGASLTINIDYYSDILATAIFQWYENNIPDSTDLSSPITGIPSATTNTLDLSTFTASAGTTYYYCTVELPSGGCDIITSNCAEIIVNPDPQIDIHPLADDTICEGGTITNALTVSYLAGTGAGNETYQWYDGIYPTGNPATTGIGFTTDTYMPLTTGLTAGSYSYYAIISFDGNDCQDAVSNQANIEVLPDPIVTITQGLNQMLCEGTSIDDICVSVSGGTVLGTYQYQWFESINGGPVGPTSGVGSNTACYTPQNNIVSITEYYCVITQLDLNGNPQGCEDTSIIATVEIIPGPYFTVQPLDSTVCEGASLTINIDYYSDILATAIFQWYENNIPDSTDLSSPITGIPSATTNTLDLSTFTASAGTTYYYCTVELPSGGCDIITSNCAEIIVNPDPQIDIHPLADDTICEGGTITNALTVSYLAGTGAGNETYQWYDGIYPTGNPATTGIGFTTDTYMPLTTGLTAGSYSYYAIISFDGNDCQDAVSNQANIEVLPDPIVTITQGLNQMLCEGTSIDDICVSVSGGTVLGTYQYQWFESINGGPVGPTSGVGSNTACYTPQNNIVSITEYYCVITQLDLNGNPQGCEDTSIIATVEIIPGPYFTVQPLDSTVCEGASLTINIDYYSDILATAIFQWYENNIPDSTDLSSPITGIPSATTNTLDLSTFTASAGTTYYYCTVELPSGGCDIITSNCAEIIVNPDPQIDIHPLADDTICEGGTITNALTVSYLAGTGAGNETYQWYDGIYPTGNPATTGIGFTTDTYMPLTTGLTAGSYSYYAIISFDGNDCQDAVSNQANIEVLPDPIVTITQGLNQMLCEGTSIDDICVSVSGGTVLGTYQYQWFESINGGPVGPTSGVGSNTACYTPQNNIVSITEYYCVITQLDLNGNPQGCEDTSIIATVEIIPGPYFTVQPLDSTVCEGASLTINIDYYSDILATAIFQWYENNIPDSTDLSSPITGIPSATTNTLDLSTFTASAGTTYYYCTVELPSGGCDIITSNCAEIIVNPDPQIDIHPLADDTICEGGTITNALTVSYLAGTGAGNETYQWYDGIYPTGNPATTGIGFTTDTYMPLTTGLTAGSYSYYAIISFDGNDCQDAVSNQANIEVLPDPIVTITQGLNQMLCEGTSIDDICVSVSGGTVLGTYQYQWFESINGGPVGPTSGVGSNTACYTPQNNIVSITEYYCVITQLDLNGNPQGCEDTSIIATVEIIPGPYFTVQPLDSTVCEGASLTINIDYYSDILATAIFQWYENNIPDSTDLSSPITGIPSATTNTLDLSTFTASAGTTYYYCTVELPSGGCDIITSNCAEIIVNPDPQIDIHPLADDTICEGGTITNALTVSYLAGTGAGNETYQWYDGIYPTGNPATTGIGFTTDTYMPLTTGLTAGSYSYYAIISFDGNDCQDAVSNQANIEVLPDPIVTITQGLNQMLCEGTSIDDICVSVSGGTVLGTYQYQWFESINGGPVGPTSGVGSNTACYTPQNNIVSITEYYCVITQLDLNGNPQGCEDTSIIATVEIIPGPYFTVQPLDSTVCEGASLTINIDYYSDILATAIFQWYENNIPDSTDLSSPITGIPSATTNTLDLSTFTASAGTTYYYCTVELPSGGCDIITSNCAEIIVNPDPQIDIHPLADDTICEGGTITNALTVSYLAGTGAGNETYQWYDGIYPTGNPATTGIGFTTDTYMPLTTGLTAGSYSYYAIISFDGNDCQDAVSNQANIEVLPDPIVTITQGLNQMLCEGTSIDDICVSVSGGTVLGTYQYQWFESINGGPVGPTSGVGSNTACYTPQNNIVSITEYYCVITQLDLNGNPQGCEDTSIIATVEIIPGPYFTVQPLDSTVCEGASLTINIDYYSDILATAIFQWYENNIPDSTDLSSPITGIPSATTNTLDLSTFTASAGTTYYYCTVELPSGGCDIITSNCAEIIVNPDPTIIPSTPMPYQMACVGAPDTLELEVTVIGGAGTPTYTWFPPAAPPIITSIPIFTPNTFLLPGLNEYFVVVNFDGNGCDADTSNIVQIDVIDVPTASFTAASICFEDPNPILITDTTSGAGPYGVITNSYWEIYNNFPPAWDNLPGDPSFTIPSFSNQIWDTIQQGVGLNTYTIKLTVSNVCGEDISTDMLTIKPRPQPGFITNQPDNCLTTGSGDTIYAGMPIDLNLNVTGYNTPTPFPIGSVCGSDGNTDWIILTAPGSNTPGPTQYDDTCCTSIITLHWPPISQCNLNAISLLYPIAGIYDICIEGFNDSTYGCISDTYCCSITVASSTVNSSFYSIDTSGCEGDNFIFWNTSTYDAGNYDKWCFDIDTTTLAPNPGSSWIDFGPQASTPYAKSHQFTDPGCYYVGLWTQNPLMNSTYIYQDTNGYIPFIVHPTPNTNFIPIDFCVGVQDTLFDNSDIDTLTCVSNIIDSINDRVWQVSSDSGASYTTVSSGIDLIHTFPTAGLWKVRLTCTSVFFCDSTAEYDILVHALPQAGFTSTSNPSCIDDYIVFNGDTIPGGSQNAWTGAPIIQWDWNFDDPYCTPLPGCSINFGNNQGSTSHSYTVNDYYDVTLTVTDNQGCISPPYEDEIHVVPGITAYFMWDTVCFSSTTPFDAIGAIDASGTFQNNSTSIDTWIWDFGGLIDTVTTGLTTSFEFNSPGSHNVSLITSAPISSVTGVVVGRCYSPPNDTTIYVWDLPQPYFTPDIVCEGEITNFTNTSSPGIDASVTQYNWAFYNNPPEFASTTPASPDTSFAFSVPNFTPGYIVELVAVDENNCSKTYTDIAVKVSNNPVPVIAFNNLTSGPFTACKGETVYLSDSSHYVDFSQSTINWQIISGPPINISSPNAPQTDAMFTTPGIYVLSLSITDQNNCSDATNITITILDNPTTVIDPIAPVCEGTPTVLTHTTNSSVGIVKYVWDFGNSAPNDTIDTPVPAPNNGNTTHPYICNNYNVILEVTDANGCRHTSAPVNATINCNPTASFNVLPVCFSSGVIQSEFISNSIPIPTTTITNYKYEFYDPGLIPLYTNPASWTFNSPGEYPVTLTIQDDQTPNCYNQVTDTALVHELPTVSFSAPEVCEGIPTELEASSSHGIQSCLWDIDLTTGGWNPPYTSTQSSTEFLFYNGSSSHSVTIFVVDSNNCTSDILTDQIEVWINPVADIYIDPLQAYCLKEPIIVSDNSTWGSGPSSSWDWNFGANANPPNLCCNYDDTIVTYNNVGWKIISLDIVDSNQCEGNTTDSILIYDLPIADFTTNSPICFGEDIEFINQSTKGDPNNHFVSFDWEFYDPTGTIDIYFGTSQQIPSTPIPTALDLSETHTYRENIFDTIGGYVSAQLTVTDSEGCVDVYHSDFSSSPQLIEIHPLPIVDFTVEPVCEGDVLVFFDNSRMDQTIFSDDLSSTNISAAIFNFAGITSSNTAPGFWPFGPPPISNVWHLPTGTYEDGPYSVTLTRQTETPYECTNDTTIPVYIKLKPNIDFSVIYNGEDHPSYFSVCGPDVIFNLDSNHYDFTQNYSFQYTLYDDLWGLHSPAIPPNDMDIVDYEFDEPGIYHLEMWINNNNGCADTVIYDIYINPRPVALFTPSEREGCEELCVNFIDESKVPANGTGGIYSDIIRWEWDLGIGTTPDINAPGPGDIDTCYMSDYSPYNVTLKVITDSLCTDQTGITTITVLPTPIPDFVTNQNGTLPGGDGVYLFDGTISTTSNGDSALPPSYIYSWTIEDGDYIINIPPAPFVGTEDKGYYSYNSLINDAWLEACLMLEDANNGCWDSICKLVRVDHFNNLIVPNFLYPTDQSSGAGEFLPKGKSLETYRLQIFDKFGNLLWETTALDENGSPTTGWKGTSLNGDVPQGTYVWRIEATYKDGEPWPGMLLNGKRVHTGIITLVR